jgi:hypothetical protein
MALIRFGGGITDARGSHAGNTFSRNKAGPHVKARVKGTNPGGNTQRTRQSLTSGLNSVWRSLSDANRMTWENYAATHPTLNKIGNTQLLSGHNWFMKLNNQQPDGFAVPFTTAPVSDNVDLPSALLLTVDATVTHTITIEIVCSSVYTPHDMYLFVSPPMSPGRAFISSQLRFLGLFLTNTPVNITLAWTNRFGTLPTVAGYRIFARAAVMTESNGILSAFLQQTALAT